MKIQLKRFLTVIVCMLGIFIMHDMAYADLDNIAPVVKSATINTPSVNKGTNIKVDLDVVEDGTGIASVKVNMYSYIGSNNSAFLLYGGAGYTGDDSESQYTGTISIDIPVAAGNVAGNYYVGYIEIVDNAGNKSVYFDQYDRDGYIISDGNSYLKLYGQEEAQKGCIITDGTYVTVISSGDDTAPIVTNVTFPSNRVEKENDIIADMEIIEESDISDIDLTYTGYKNGQSILIGNWPVRFSKHDDIFTTRMDILKSDTAGIYSLTEINVVDSHGNRRRYVCNSEDGNKEYYKDENGYYLVDEDDINIKCYITDGASVEVVSDGDDVAPIIDSITIKKDVITKPGILPIELKLDDKDEIYMITVNVNRCGMNELESYDFTVQYDEQKKKSVYIVDFPISTNMNSDEYYIESIVIMDGSGNVRNYVARGTDGNPYIEENGTSYMVEYGDYSVKVPFTSNSTFEVKDEFDVGFEVALSNSKLISMIDSMEEGKTARIYIDGKGIATKEMFEAIAQKDKTLVFYKNNYQWVFNGLNVTNPKDIELKIKFSLVDGDEYNVSGDLLKIDFAPNGELPGIANVRVKSDYTFNLFEMKNSMYLYYFDKKANTLSYEEDSDINYVLDGSDHWCQFNISHNSTYMVSGDKIKMIKKMSIDSISKKLAAGKKMTLCVITNFGNASAKDFKWSSSNKKYATVTSNGVVTAKNAGKGKKVKITAKATDGSGKKATVTITIMKDSVKSIKLKASSTSIKAGKTLKIKSTVKTTGKNAHTTLKWQSSNNKYAVVSSNGKVTAMKAGKGKKVKITAMATDGSGKKATLTIKIK